jgi:putative endonuclease
VFRVPASASRRRDGKRETYRDNLEIKLSNASTKKFVLSKGFTYILECADGTFYTGSTKDLEKRIWQHNNGLGANYTKARLPVDLVYYEEYIRIDEAFHREKQIQGWSRKKKLALIEGKPELLPKLSKKIFKKQVVSISPDKSGLLNHHLES